MLAELLYEDELDQLGRDLYRLRGVRCGAVGGLYDFEEEWFSRRLPSPPARVLVGGAGTGREAVALAERGYAVDAFDPIPGAVEVARTRLGDAGIAVRASYQELGDAVTARRGPAACLAERRYDAVLFGAASFIHVLADEDRARSIAAADALCPEGPVLLSRLWKSDRLGSRHARSVRAGKLAGRLLGRLRGAPPCAVPIELGPGMGFVRKFTAAELESLAGSVGRQVLMEPMVAGAFHVTLLTD